MAIHFASLKAHTPVFAARVAARPSPIDARGMAAAPRFRLSDASPRTAAASPPPAPSFAASFLALFGGVSSPPPAQAPSATAAAPSAQAPRAAPTAEEVFGPAPWLTRPTGIGPDGVSYDYNPLYFAAPETAAAVAQMVGGTVVQSIEFTSAPGSTFQQQQPNLMVRLSNGALINPGLVAGFYTHGYPQSLVDQMIAGEVANTKA
jgi:hypothetical protein